MYSVLVYKLNEKHAVEEKSFLNSTEKFKKTPFI